LAEGPVLVRQVQRQAQDAGIALRTLRRAKEALRVESKRKGYGRGSKIFWVLPKDEKLIAQFRERDLDELADKLCYGPTDVDLADDGSMSWDEFFGASGRGRDDEADWWKKGKPRGNTDDGSDDEPADPVGE